MPRDKKGSMKEQEPFTGQIVDASYYEAIAPVVRILRLVPDLKEPPSNVIPFPVSQPPEVA